ncbi:unnamed protein product [Symbiodinium sp. CCMP2592]|nr:unnamed protein product [Symbiodinium sp. CCMP2592]
MELFAMGLRSDGYTPEIYEVEFYETLETAVAMGKRLGYRLSDGAPPKGLPTRRSGLDAAKTLIKSGEIKIISVCVQHYQSALESGLLKKNSVGPGYPVSHTFQRHPGKPLNLMSTQGKHAEIHLSDMKVAVSVMQAPASPPSESMEDTGAEVVAVSGSPHRLVFYGYSVNDSSRRINDALFKNMTKSIPGLTDCASEHMVLFSDIASAPLLSFCVSGGDNREMVLDKYVAEELPARFKHIPASPSPISGFWAVKVGSDNLTSAGVQLSGRLSTMVRVDVITKQSRQTTNDIARERQMEQVLKEELGSCESEKRSLQRLMAESKRRRLSKEASKPKS